MTCEEMLRKGYQEALPPALKRSVQLGARQSEPLPKPDERLLPDGYSRLRHRRWMLYQDPGNRSFLEASWWEIEEKSALLTAASLERWNPSQREELLEGMMLCAAMDSGDKEAMVILAKSLRVREYTRPLIRKLFRQLDPFHRQQCLRSRLAVVCGEEASNEDLRLTLELWAEHPGEGLSDETQHQLLERCFPSEKLLRALLQCAGNNKHNHRLMADWLQETSFSACSPRLQQAMMDYGTRNASPRTYGLLQAWEKELAERASVDIWLPEYARRCVAECRLRLSLAPGNNRKKGAAREQDGSTGLVLAQFMFYGDLMMPGKANSGGIATLLRTLGDALAGCSSVEQVITFMMMPCDERAATAPLTTLLAPGHTLVRVPVFFDEVCSPELFREKEYDIYHSLERVMELLSIDPDIFHMRYSDNASLAAALLAHNRGGKAVFTVTPDPHRSIRTTEEMTAANPTSPDQEPAGEMPFFLGQMNKVGAADDIIGICQGVLGIGPTDMAGPLLAYFPQLAPAADQARILFQMIPEGIRLSVGGTESLGDGEINSRQPGEDRLPLRRLFAAHTGKYRLSPERRHLPVILTVGRLDPLKGQIRLLEAWSDPVLAAAFNLVLIGGDHQQPDSKEQEVLAAIDAYMHNHPTLLGGFCHLERMDNDELRRLQRAMSACPPGGWPPVYVSASLKEEFGLSIIEAMAAGMLVIGPEAGGVGSYVTNGNNGFLVDTRDASCLQRGLKAILLDPGRSAKNWQGIAARGKATVAERFDLQAIAGDFFRFYRQLINRQGRKEG